MADDDLELEDYPPISGSNPSAPAPPDSSTLYPPVMAGPKYEAPTSAPMIDSGGGQPPVMPLGPRPQPNLQHDVMAGAVAPPNSQDEAYQPVKPSTKSTIMNRIAAGMLGFHSPAAGVAARQRFEEEPKIEAQQNLAHDTAEYNNAATQGLAQSREASEAPLRAAQTNEANARATALDNPQVKGTPEEQFMHDALNGGPNGTPKPGPDGKPYTYLSAHQAWKQAEQDTKADKTPTFEEQSYEEWHKTHPNGTRLQYEQAKSAATQKPEHEPKQLAVGPDGTVIELRPGVKVPQGTKSVSGDLKGAEPTADEKRRADLGKNMNENLDQLEDILTRRPDLFGPVAGRMTTLKGAVGTGDPDIAALSVIKEQLGMAMVGAHAMRNAQHVEAAANSIMNSFHNDPTAVKSAVDKARSSLQTFQNDVENPRQTQGAGGGKAGSEKLTVDQARDYLQKAGGDKEKARAMAKKDGHSF